jgi:pimeloyl-ACP methyl ester carboxylesterase
MGGGRGGSGEEVAMRHESIIDEHTGRKFYLDAPDDVGRPLTFLLNLHGGGSFGAWQRLYFPAHDYADAHAVVVATPTAATAEPSRRWIGEADDEHLHNVVNLVVDRFGPDRIASFWLVGHSQGGMTSRRLLDTAFFADRADGWLSLSGGRIGGVPRAEGSGPPSVPGGPQLGISPAELERLRASMAEPPNADVSFIFATGEHEIAELPAESAWAQRYGAGARVRQPDVVDTEPGQVWDKIREGYSTPQWGLLPRPGTAQVWVYPGARDGTVIADVVRLDKGHTEGLEPHITEELVRMMVAAPAGQAKAGARASAAARPAGGSR